MRSSSARVLPVTSIRLSSITPHGLFTGATLAHPLTAAAIATHNSILTGFGLAAGLLIGFVNVCNRLGISGSMAPPFSEISARLIAKPKRNEGSRHDGQDTPK
jgi:hypothetical protein